MRERLHAVQVEGYRCFRDPFELELRPLTFVYGWNNSGKSAGTRLVKLLGDSLRENARAPLDPLGGPTYRDLVWKPAVTKPGPLRFGLNWTGGEPRGATWRLDYDRDVSRMYVRELHITRGEGEATTFRAIRAKGEDIYQVGSRDKEHKLRFRGLIPYEGPAETAELADRLQELRGRCHWLAGDRVQPPRFVPAGEPPPLEIDPRGVGATEILLNDEEILEEVRKWYARPPISRQLDRKVEEATARLLLNPARVSFDIDLVDAGAGMGQVLPVVTSVAKALATVRQDEEAVVAIEEPESQLHPNAQRVLGEWLCEVASQRPAPRLVLETHSRLLILATQLAIARGVLDPSRVGVYWLDLREDGSTAWQMVEFDEAGRPGEGWPRDVFADELDLAEALAEHQFAGKLVRDR